MDCGDATRASTTYHWQLCLETSQLPLCMSYTPCQIKHIPHWLALKTALHAPYDLHFLVQYKLVTAPCSDVHLLPCCCSPAHLLRKTFPTCAACYLCSVHVPIHPISLQHTANTGHLHPKPSVYRNSSTHGRLLPFHNLLIHPFLHFCYLSATDIHWGPPCARGWPIAPQHQALQPEPQVASQRTCLLMVMMVRLVGQAVAWAGAEREA